RLVRRRQRSKVGKVGIDYCRPPGQLTRFGIARHMVTPLQIPEPRVFSVVDPDTTRLPGHRVKLAQAAPLKLDCGAELGPVNVAYQTYGRLNTERSNAILVCHALTGDQFAAGSHPVTGKAGWWELTIGPGLPLDTERYF